MCGIVGYVGMKKNAIDTIIHGLETLEYRGYDSAGIAYYNDDKLNIIKKKGRIDELKSVLPKDNSSIGIGHTRWATHGEPNEINAHPHHVGKITLVHNGIIENYKELREELKEYGYIFESETDTEVACATLDKLYKDTNDMLKAIQLLEQTLEGSYALAILCDDDKESIYAVRAFSPMIIALDESDKFIASDVPAILEYTKNYYLLNDYDIVHLTKDKIKFYNKDLNEEEKQLRVFEGSMEAGMKCGYEHFMLKEINEEPDVVKDTIKYYYDGNIETLMTTLPDMDKYNQIHIVACGSAYHTGLIAKSWIEEIAGIPVYCEIASEYRYKNTFYDDKTLVIIISQSGETADSLACLRKASNDEIDTLAIVNVVGSSIAREADNVLYIKAGCEIAVATTKAYVGQVALLSLISLKLAYIHGKITDEQIKEYNDSLKVMKKNIKELISRDDYKKIADKIYEREDIFYLGRKMDYAIGMEGSLKLKEISYINSVAYAAGELKHGTISLIEDGTPVISVITEEDIIPKTLSNVKETKARGSYSIVVTTEDNIEADDLIMIPKVSPLLQPILTIIPLQLLAYEVAKLRGCDIDKPKNLAKSVTVE